MWPSSQTLSGLLQFALSVISLVAARLYDHWRRLHAGARKKAHAASAALHVRSPHSQAQSGPRRISHQRTRAIHAQASLGERAADGVAAAVGSWRFVLTQAGVMVIWIALNTTALILHWDSYPFVFLNLAMSAEAAFATPIILMSQNRQGAKDRVRDNLEAREVDVMTKQLKLLETINRQQLEILKALHTRPDQPLV